MAARVILSQEPTGTIKHYAGGVVPSPYLACDGSAVSRTTYAALFAIIGITYGAGDTTTTFNVPDFRGRGLLGDGAGPGLTPRTVGQSLGTEVHSIGSANLPTHTHTIDHGHNDGVSSGTTGVTANNHTHTIDHGHSAGVSSGTTGVTANNHTHTINHFHNDGQLFGQGAYADAQVFTGSGHSHLQALEGSGSQGPYAYQGTNQAVNVAAGDDMYVNTNVPTSSTAVSGTNSSSLLHGSVGIPSFNGNSGISLSADTNHSHGFTGTATVAALAGGNSGISLSSSTNHSHGFTGTATVAALAGGNSGNGLFANTSIDHVNPTLVVKFLIRY